MAGGDICLKICLFCIMIVASFVDATVGLLSGTIGFIPLIGSVLTWADTLSEALWEVIDLGAGVIGGGINMKEGNSMLVLCMLCIYIAAGTFDFFADFITNTIPGASFIEAVGAIGLEVIQVATGGIILFSGGGDEEKNKKEKLKEMVNKLKTAYS